MIMKTKAQIVKEQIELMQLIDTELKKLNYFEIYGNEPREKILVTLYLDIDKKLYFNGQQK
jgi:hypothetical protein